MIADHSNDLLSFKKAQKRKSIDELNSIREELLQLQLASHQIIDLLKEGRRPQEEFGNYGFALFAYRYRDRNIALLERLDRYIKNAEG